MTPIYKQIVPSKKQKPKVTDPLATPFFHETNDSETGNYSLRVVRSGKTAAGDHYYVHHDGVCVRLATQDEIELWIKVIEADIKFKTRLDENGNASRYLLKDEILHVDDDAFQKIPGLDQNQIAGLNTGDDLREAMLTATDLRQLIREHRALTQQVKCGLEIEVENNGGGWWAHIAGETSMLRKTGWGETKTAAIGDLLSNMREEIGIVLKIK